MYPEVVDMNGMNTFQDAEARLAEVLPTYESRPQQQLMASKVEAAIALERHLAVQAGCGTGKSFGYIIPAVLSGKRAVISTATKALQDQIALGDLPFLAEHLGVDFTFAVLKGRSNYLCLNKAVEADAGQVRSLSAILARAAEDGFDGTREGLGFEVTAVEWNQVNADSDDCQAFGCKDNPDGCFAQRARLAAKEADIVVVNHALYFTDMMVMEATGGNASLLDKHDVVIFDEAHEIEEYASSVLGARFTEAGIRATASEVRNWARRVDDQPSADAVTAAEKVIDAASVLWAALTEAGTQRIRMATVQELEEEFVGLAFALQDLPLALGNCTLEGVAGTEVAKLKKQRDRLVRRAQGASRRFNDIAAADFADLVRWVEEETTRRGDKIKVIKSAPVNVGTILREWLFAAEDGPTAILTSATILVNGSADYIAERVGLDDFDHLDVGTPFDFASQAVLYVPEHLPIPTGNSRGAWESLSLVEIRKLIEASDGRALILFTSNAQMRGAYNMVSRMVPYTCLMQGQRPNKDLAAEFMADHHSVLFATRSFFTGVDFQGEACSLVIMDKLPFPVPTEPVTEARCEAIQARGGNPFTDYTVPVMSLVLQQGFGRLIRHRNDTGVVAILDSRLLTKPYGRVILNSLPPARRVTKDGEPEAAFADFATAKVS